MKKLIYIAFISLLLTGISSCKKNELPQAVDGKPTVWVEGYVNGVPFKYEAGTNASYANVIAHNIDSQSRQYIFKINAPDLNKSLEISINNGARKLGTVQEDLDKTIQTGTYKFVHSNSFPYVPYRTSEIILLYIDHNTQSKFYTVPYDQNSINSRFEIASVSDVMYNGKRYKVAEIFFHCRVKNPSNGFWYDITDGHGYIPFGEE